MVWPLLDGDLLGFQHVFVFPENAGHTFAQLVRQALLGHPVVARKSPKIMAGVVGLWRDGVQHKAVHAFAAVASATGFGRRTRASLSHAHINVHRAGRFKPDDLPAVNLALVAPRFFDLPGPERGRVDVFHPAGDGGGTVAMGGNKRRLGHRAVANAGAVDKGLVGQVHQVVNHQAVVTFDVNHLAVAGPLGIVVPVHVRDQGRVSLGRVTRPHPDKTVTFKHRKAAHASRGVQRFLAGHVHTAALRVVHQAVVAAGDFIALQVAK